MEREQIEETINKCIESETQVASDIYDAFVIYYGEDNVDTNLHSIKSDCKTHVNTIVENDYSEITETYILNLVYSYISRKLFEIYVHWPKITIQNEKKNKIDIEDLFCVVYVNMCNGRFMDVRFVRSTFNPLQFNSGYIHSHIRQRQKIYVAVNPSDYDAYTRRFTEKDSFCFGRAPIKSTMLNLGKANVTYKTEDYLLFCRELDICVRIESLNGVPYVRMSSLGEQNEYQYCMETYPFNEFTINDVEEEFTKYFLGKSNLNFVFNGSHYEIGCSFNDFAIEATKVYYKFMNENKGKYSKSDLVGNLESVIKSKGEYFIDTVGFKDVKFYEWINSRNIVVMKFKGVDYPLRIVDDSNEGERKPKMMFLNKNMVSFLYHLVTLIINSDIYGRKGNKIQLQEGKQTDNEHEEVLYSFFF